MSQLPYFVSAASVRHLKLRAKQKAPTIPSAHLSEALASALGFNTNASLRSALAGKATAAAQPPSNARMVARLQQLGHQVRPGANLVPDLQAWVHPFSGARVPMPNRQSARWRVWRNIMVSAINAGLEQGLFGLSPGENWWPGGAPSSHACKSHTYEFRIAPDLPARASVDAHAGEELKINVQVVPRKGAGEPSFEDGLESASATANGWLERSLGVWLQNGAHDVHCKANLKPMLANLQVVPAGYADIGKLMS